MNVFSFVSCLDDFEEMFFSLVARVNSVLGDFGAITFSVGKLVLEFDYCCCSIGFFFIRKNYLVLLTSLC